MSRWPSAGARLSRGLVRPLAVTALVLCGCGGGSAHLLPTQHRRADGCRLLDDADAHVEVYLALRGPAGERPFCPGDHLRPDDALQVTVEVVQAAHMQLIYVDPRGEAGTLERQDVETTTRVGVFRIPPGLLTQHVGEAQLFLMVSLDPLPRSDPAMSDLWTVIHETGSFVDRSGQIHPPRHDAASSKPLHFDATAALHADFDENGVAMLALSLRAGD